jgi:hypothetical protein
MVPAVTEGPVDVSWIADQDSLDVVNDLLWPARRAVIQVSIIISRFEKLIRLPSFSLSFSFRFVLVAVVLHGGEA